MTHEHTPPPPPAARDTDRPEASPKPKRAWSKPTLKRMTYVHAVAGGPHQVDAGGEWIKYNPTS